MQERRNGTSVIVVFLRWSVGPDTGLQLVSRTAYIHNLNQEVKWVLEPTGGPCGTSNTSVDLSGIASTGKKAVERIGWLALCTRR
jgi:hypothetical protein